MGSSEAGYNAWSFPNDCVSVSLCFDEANTPRKTCAHGVPMACPRVLSSRFSFLREAIPLIPCLLASVYESVACNTLELQLIAFLVIMLIDYVKSVDVLLLVVDIWLQNLL